jgi:hypothetical protein
MKARLQMKNLKIEANDVLRSYLYEAFHECGRPELGGKKWISATLFSGANRDWPKKVDEYMHGEGDSSREASDSVAAHIIRKFGNVAIRADERLAEPNDQWITEFEGPGEVRTDEKVVGIIHPHIHEVDELSDVFQDAITLPFGLVFVMKPGSPSCPSADAFAAVVTGVFDGEAFLLLEVS